MQRRGERRGWGIGGVFGGYRPSLWTRGSPLPRSHHHDQEPSCLPNAFTTHRSGGRRLRLCFAREGVYFGACGPGGGIML